MFWAGSLLLAACSSQVGQRPEESVERSDAVEPVSSVQWMFDPAPDERPRLDSLLHRLDTAAVGPDFRLGGELYRFGSAAGSQRYLLVASRDTTPPPAVLGEQEFLLYVFSRQDVSDPYRVSASRDSSHPFAVAEIADFDSDGLLDLGYCLDGSEEDGGVLSVLGYRADEWYRIAPPLEHRLCR